MYARELDRRNSDGVDVTLLWDSESGALWIEVEDQRGGDHFRLDVDPADAMTAFNHPYAYTSYRRHKHALAA